MNKPDASGRWKMLVIFGTPFLLMVAAWTMYYTGVGVPQRTHNAGVLIQPPLLEPALDIDRWTLVLSDDGRCDADCKRLLYLSRQAHIALGKEAFRVARLYYHHAALAAPAAEHLREQHPNMLAQRAPAALPPLPGLERARLFLVNPNRQLIMAYCADGVDEAAGCSGNGILHDVKFLLRHSRAGRAP